MVLTINPLSDDHWKAYSNSWNYLYKKYPKDSSQAWSSPVFKKYRQLYEKEYDLKFTKPYLKFNSEESLVWWLLTWSS